MFVKLEKRLGRITQCRGCGADIAFIKTVAGKSMPVDPNSIRFTPAGGPGYSRNGNGYSGKGDMTDQLPQMMDEAPDDLTRREIQKLMERMENQL